MIQKAKNFRRILSLFAAISFATISLGPVVFAATGTPPPPSSDPLCLAGFKTIGGVQRYDDKDQFIADYLHKSFHTPKQNLAWMKLGKKLNTRSGSWTTTIEFAELGPLNRVTADKNFVTSFGNKIKELSQNEFEAFRARTISKYSKFVDVEITKELTEYDDWKNIKVTILPRPKPLHLVKSKADSSYPIPKEVVDDMQGIFVRVNSQFVEFVRANGFDVDTRADIWFRGGIGKTPDEAELAGRLSREMAGPNVTRNFEDPQIQIALDNYKAWAEEMRRGVPADPTTGRPAELGLIQLPSMKPLLKDEFIDPEVLDIVAKTQSIDSIRERLARKYGAEITRDEVERLRTYNMLIDNFSLNPHVAERKVASLERADHGGMSLDFAGLSAKNRGATAEALAGAKGLRDAVRRVRRGEQTVTRMFKAMSQNVKKIVDPFLESSVLSGDDFVGLFDKPWTLKRKHELVDALSTLKNPSAQRVAFISEGVDPKHRNLLAAHGEAIEKVLRQELEGVVKTEKLREVVFAIDMGGKKIGDGQVDLIIGVGSEAHLSPQDRKAIHDAFEAAVQKFNSKPDTDPKVKKAYKTK